MNTPSNQSKKQKALATGACPDAANKKRQAFATECFEQTPSNFAKQHHLDGKSCGIAEQCGVAEYSTASKKSTPHGPTISDDCPFEDESGWISASDDACKMASAYTESSPHFIQLMRESHLSTSHPQNKKPQALATEPVEVVQHLMGRLKGYRKLFEDGLADIDNREKTTPNWKEEQGRVKEQNSNLLKEHKEISESIKSIREKLALLGHVDESIELEYAELIRCDSEVQEVQEVQEEEETLVEDMENPLIHQLTSNLKRLEVICKRLGADYDFLEAKRVETVKLDEQNKQLQASLIQKEAFRRSLLNKLMDKRGCIRVFCRIRPRVHTGVGVSSIPFESSYKDTITLFGEQPKQFTFDQVFPVDASQDDVFLEISHLVDCAISGEKVCIFCYGRSGSGKTYSMYGEDGRMGGIIPRSLEKIYNAEKETTFDVKMTEVLTKFETKLMDPCSSKDLKMETMLTLLVQAENKRDTKSTMLNTKSSRSHVLLEIEISSTDLVTRKVTQGVLCFADLAGNQSPDGDTDVKGKGINTDLLHLRTVLMDIAAGKGVSYRDCKLTQLIWNYLKEGAKTLTLLHIDLDSSRTETLNTLDFGKVAASCNLTSLKSKTPRHQ